MADLVATVERDGDGERVIVRCAVGEGEAIAGRLRGGGEGALRERGRVKGESALHDSPMLASRVVAALDERLTRIALLLTPRRGMTHNDECDGASCDAGECHCTGDDDDGERTIVHDASLCTCGVAAITEALALIDAPLDVDFRGTDQQADIEAGFGPVVGIAASIRKATPADEGPPHAPMTEWLRGVLRPKADSVEISDRKLIDPRTDVHLSTLKSPLSAESMARVNRLLVAGMRVMVKATGEVGRLPDDLEPPCTSMLVRIEGRGESLPFNADELVPLSLSGHEVVAITRGGRHLVQGPQVADDETEEATLRLERRVSVLESQVRSLQLAASRGIT